LRIALLGCGFIGKTIARAAVDGRLPGAHVCAVSDLAKTPAVDAICEETGAEFIGDPLELPKAKPDLVVEAAGQEAAGKYAVPLVSAGSDILLMSVGALVDSTFAADLERAARSAARRILIPSGAIGGLDVLRAAAIAGLDEVTLLTRKPPLGLASSDGTQSTAATEEEAVLFEGPASEAVKKFPKNVNVAAAISLAGLGFERTKVKVISDPKTRRNTHTVVARGAFGEMSLTVENVPSPDNPRTSYLAALSAISTLKRYSSALIVGA